MSVEIRGIEQFDALVRSLEGMGRNLQRELLAAAEKGASGLEGSAKSSALQVLPKRGGLARIVASSAFVSHRAGARYSLQAKNRRDIRTLNRGVVRHPVWGHRDRWVVQRIRKGWWDIPAEDARRAVEDEVQRAMDRLAQTLGHR